MKLKAWRIVVGCFEHGVLRSLYSTYTKEETPYDTVLADPKGFHVGTKRDFCLAYYRGMIDETKTRREILMELSVDSRDLQTPDMVQRFKPAYSFMGGEAITRKATVLSWSFASEAVREI